MLLLDGRLSPACRLAALRVLADRLPAAIDGNSAFVAVLPEEVDRDTVRAALLGADGDAA
ncbi:MAG TPA: hypothetical protein VIL13_01990 [Longimicrobiales bacterium]